mgnify:CR=1 FL=1
MENGLDKLTSREILQMYTRVSEFITFLNKEEKNTEKILKEKYDVDTCIDEKEKLEQLVKDIMENCYKLDVPLVVEMYTTDEEGNEVDLINVEDPQLKVMMPYYKEIETTKKLPRTGC